MAVVAAGPASPSKKGTGWRLASLFSRSKSGTKKNQKDKGEAGTRLLDGSISSSSSRSSPKSVAAAAKSVAAAASGAPKKSLPPIPAAAAASVKGSKSPKPASPPGVAAAASWSSDDSPKPAPRIRFKINPLPDPKGAVAMGGPKSPKPIQILRPDVIPPASPKGKGSSATLPALLGLPPTPPVGNKRKRVTPLPAPPKKFMSPVIEATEDWKPSSFFDNDTGKPVMVSDLGWGSPKSSPAKKLSASKSMKAKGALSTGKAISGLLDLKAIGTEEEKVARKKADKLKKHQMLIHQGKIKKANAYLKKHNLKPSMDAIDDIIGHVSVVMDKSGTPHLVSPKTKSSMDYLKSPKTKNSMDYLKSPKTKNSMDYLDSPLSVVELTPSIGDSPLSVVELTPSASPSSHSNYKHDKSFGKLADALAAAAAESPKSSRSSRSGRGIRSRSGSRSSTKSSSSMDYLKNIHKKVVNPGVSPTFKPRIPKDRVLM